MRIILSKIILLLSQMPNHSEKFKVWLLCQNLYCSAACDLFWSLVTPVTEAGLTELQREYLEIITQVDNDIIWSYALLFKILNAQFSKIL